MALNFDDFKRHHLFKNFNPMLRGSNFGMCRFSVIVSISGVGMIIGSYVLVKIGVHLSIVTKMGYPLLSTSSDHFLLGKSWGCRH